MRARAHSGRGSAGAYRFVCVPACPRECVRAHQCVCVPTSVRACVLCVCVCARAAACLCVHVRESASVCLYMRATVHVHARARVDGGDERRGRGVVHTVMTTMYTLNSMRSTTYGTNCTLASVRSKSGAPQRQRKTSGAGNFRAETSARKLPRRTHPVQTTQTCEPTSAAGTHGVAGRPAVRRTRTRASHRRTAARTACGGRGRAPSSSLASACVLYSRTPRWVRLQSLLVNRLMAEDVGLRCDQRQHRTALDRRPRRVHHIDQRHDDYLRRGCRHARSGSPLALDREPAAVADQSPPSQRRVIAVCAFGAAKKGTGSGAWHAGCHQVCGLLHVAKAGRDSDTCGGGWASSSMSQRKSSMAQPCSAAASTAWRKLRARVSACACARKTVHARRSACARKSGWNGDYLTRARTLKRTLTRARARAAHGRTHGRTRTRARTQAHARARALTNTHKSARAHAHAQTHAHTYTHAHTHAQRTG